MLSSGGLVGRFCPAILYGPVRRPKFNPQKRRPNSDRYLRDTILRSHTQTAKANATYQDRFHELKLRMIGNEKHHLSIWFIFRHHLHSRRDLPWYFLERNCDGWSFVQWGTAAASVTFLWFVLARQRFVQLWGVLQKFQRCSWIQGHSWRRPPLIRASWMQVRSWRRPSSPVYPNWGMLLDASA